MVVGTCPHFKNYLFLEPLNVKFSHRLMLGAKKLKVDGIDAFLKIYHLSTDLWVFEIL